MFKARYINRKTGAEYWRTVYGDSINEAFAAAERYVRKGFYCHSMKQEHSRYA